MKYAPNVPLQNLYCRRCACWTLKQRLITLDASCHPLCHEADGGPGRPTVLRCVRAALSKALVSIVSHLIAMVLDHQAWEDLATSLPSQGLPESVLSKVPKVWCYVAPSARGSEASKGMYAASFTIRSQFNRLLNF